MREMFMISTVIAVPVVPVVFRAAPHASVRVLLYFTAVIYFLYFFISASLISAVSQPIWLKFGS